VAEISSDVEIGPAGCFKWLMPSQVISQFSLAANISVLISGHPNLGLQSREEKDVDEPLQTSDHGLRKL